MRCHDATRFGRQLNPRTSALVSWMIIQEYHTSRIRWTLTCSLLVLGPHHRRRVRSSTNIVISPSLDNTTLRPLSPLQIENYRKHFPKLYKTYTFLSKSLFENHFKIHLEKYLKAPQNTLSNAARKAMTKNHQLKTTFPNPLKNHFQNIPYFLKLFWKCLWIHIKN